MEIRLVVVLYYKQAAKRPKQKQIEVERMRKRKVLRTLGAVSVLALAFSFTTLADDASQFVTGTDVNGIVIGGLTEAEAKAKIEQSYASSYNLTIIEKDGKKEVVGTFYSEPFSTSSGTVSNETIGAGEARIYYYAGYLHLNNLESYRCYIVGFNGTVLDAFEVTDLNESRLMSFSKGSYIITAINGNDRITRKFVIK